MMKPGENYNRPQTFVKAPACTPEFKQMLLKKVPWKKIIKTMVKESLGGYTYVNGNGVTAIKPPSYDWCRLLLQYSQGMPTQLVESDETTRAALESFKQFAKDFSLPVPNTPAISTSGELVSTQPSTVKQETVETETGTQ